MSIAVLIGVHDGLVLASDSASTLVPSAASLPPDTPSGTTVVINVYDNAKKIFNLIKGQPIGCVAFGRGSVGNASVATLIKDLRKKLTDKAEAAKLKFDIENYSMEQVTNIIGAFLGEECKKLTPADAAATHLGLLIGGYSVGKNLGESWSIEIKQGVTQPATKLRKDDAPAVSWGGAGEVLQRMVMGFTPTLYELLGQISNPPQSAEMMQQHIGPILTSK